jgi:hypothetical protein
MTTSQLPKCLCPHVTAQQNRTLCNFKPSIARSANRRMTTQPSEGDRSCTQFALHSSRANTWQHSTQNVLLITGLQQSRWFTKLHISCSLGSTSCTRRYDRPFTRSCPYLLVSSRCSYSVPFNSSFLHNLLYPVPPTLSFSSSEPLPLCSLSSEHFTVSSLPPNFLRAQTV